jgi:hypothetical protein
MSEGDAEIGDWVDAGVGWFDSPRDLGEKATDFLNCDRVALGICASARVAGRTRTLRVLTFGPRSSVGHSRQWRCDRGELGEPLATSAVYVVFTT